MEMIDPKSGLGMVERLKRDKIDDQLNVKKHETDFEECVPSSKAKGVYAEIFHLL